MAKENQDGGKEVKSAVKVTTKIIKSIFSTKLIWALVIGIVAIIAVAAFSWQLKMIRGRENPDDPRNAPSAVREYTNNMDFDDDGNIVAGQTIQEFWDELVRSGNWATTYLSSPQELAKLVNAQRATELPDTRPAEEQDNPLDWNTINSDVNSTEVHGLVKLKRALSSGNTINMEYVSPDRFQSYINNYNNSGSNSARNEALKYYTLERKTQTVNLNTQAGVSAGAPNIADATHEDFSSQTRAIINQYRDQIYEGSPLVQQIEQMGFDNWVKTLGGVFTKYGGRDVFADVKTAGDLQEVAEYVWGLMTMYGFDYGSNRAHHDWGVDADEDVGRAFYPLSNKDMSYSGHTSIDAICGNPDKVKRTCCNIGVDVFVYKTGLLGTEWESACNYPSQKITNKEDLQVGDLVHFYSGGDWCHVAIVGEVDKANDKIILYDAGSRFIESGKYKHEFTGNYGYSSWHGERFANIDQSTTIGTAVQNASSQNASGQNSSANTSSTTQNGNIAGTLHWPAPDYTEISSPFGTRNAQTAGASTNHKGVDLAAPSGSNIEVAEAGTVEISTYSDSAGNYVVINHGNGVKTRYLHMNERSQLRVGYTVTRGQVIGHVGSTGNSSDPHLHFEILINNTPVNPMNYKYDNGMGDGNATLNIQTASNTTALPSSSSIQTAEKTYFVAKVATWSEDTTKVISNDPDVDAYTTRNYYMTTREIPLKDFVGKYSLPFNYLWALLLIGQDKQFVFDVADLSFNSKLEITIHDNETTTTDITIDEYTVTSTMNYDADVNTQYRNEGSEEYDFRISTYESRGNRLTTQHHFKVEKRFINKTNTLDIALTLADAWCCKYEKNYSRQNSENESNTTESIADVQRLDDGKRSYDSGQSDCTNILIALGKADTQQKYGQNIIFGSSSIINFNATYDHYTRYSPRQIKNKIETSTYIASPETYEEKTDKNATTPNFVSLFSKNYNARSNIMSANSGGWLFSILEKNENTVKMVDLTKYLIFKATGTNTGVTSFDFSTYNPSDFVNVEIPGGSDLAQFKEWLHAWEGGSVSSDGRYYIVESDGSSRGSAVGHGVDIRAHGAELRAAGYSTSIGSRIPVEVVDAIEDREINENIQQVRERTSGLNLKEYQIYALVSRAYNCGIDGALKERNGKTFVEAFRSYWNETSDNKFGNKDAVNYNHTLYTNYMSKPDTSEGSFLRGLKLRRESEWLLFQTGYFDRGVNNYYSPSSSANIEAVCQEVSQMLINRNAHYSSGRMTYGDIKKAYEGDTKVVCASYATMVLYRAGLLTEQQINPYNYHFTGDYPSMLEAAGWKRVSKRDLKPGDVINKPSRVSYGGGHVVIYVGNGMIWDQRSAVVSTSGNAPTGRAASGSYYINNSEYVAWRAPQNF